MTYASAILTSMTPPGVVVTADTHVTLMKGDVPVAVLNGIRKVQMLREAMFISFAGDVLFGLRMFEELRALCASTFPSNAPSISQFESLAADHLRAEWGRLYGPGQGGGFAMLVGGRFTCDTGAVSLEALRFSESEAFQGERASPGDFLTIGSGADAVKAAVFDGFSQPELFEFPSPPLLDAQAQKFHYLAARLYHSMLSVSFVDRERPDVGLFYSSGIVTAHAIPDLLESYPKQVGNVRAHGMPDLIESLAEYKYRLEVWQLEHGSVAAIA